MSTKNPPNVSSVKVYQFFEATTTQLLDPSKIFDVLQGKNMMPPLLHDKTDLRMNQSRSRMDGTLGAYGRTKRVLQFRQRVNGFWTLSVHLLMDSSEGTGQTQAQVKSHCKEFVCPRLTRGYCSSFYIGLQKALTHDLAGLKFFKKLDPSNWVRWVSQEWCTVNAQSEVRVAGGSSVKD